MSNQTNCRIVVRDYDQVGHTIRLHDKQGELSDILISLEAIINWRYDDDSRTRTRLQLFMRHIKKQGGKQTIMDMINYIKSSKYYEV